MFVFFWFGLGFLCVVFWFGLGFVFSSMPRRVGCLGELVGTLLEHISVHSEYIEDKEKIMHPCIKTTLWQDCILKHLGNFESFITER